MQCGVKQLPRLLYLKQTSWWNLTSELVLVTRKLFLISQSFLSIYTKTHFAPDQHVSTFALQGGRFWYRRVLIQTLSWWSFIMVSGKTLTENNVYYTVHYVPLLCGNLSRVLTYWTFVWNTVIIRIMNSRLMKKTFLLLWPWCLMSSSLSPSGGLCQIWMHFLGEIFPSLQRDGWMAIVTIWKHDVSMAVADNEV